MIYDIFIRSKIFSLHNKKEHDIIFLNKEIFFLTQKAVNREFLESPRRLHKLNLLVIYVKNIKMTNQKLAFLNYYVAQETFLYFFMILFDSEKAKIMTKNKFYCTIAFLPGEKQKNPRSLDSMSLRLIWTIAHQTRTKSIFAVDLLLPVQFMQNNTSRLISLLQWLELNKVEHCRKKKKNSISTFKFIEIDLRRRRRKVKASLSMTNWPRGKCCIRSTYHFKISGDRNSIIRTGSLTELQNPISFSAISFSANHIFMNFHAMQHKKNRCQVLFFFIRVNLNFFSNFQFIVVAGFDSDRRRKRKVGYFVFFLFSDHAEEGKCNQCQLFYYREKITFIFSSCSVNKIGIIFKRAWRNKKKVKLQMMLALNTCWMLSKCRFHNLLCTLTLCLHLSYFLMRSPASILRREIGLSKIMNEGKMVGRKRLGEWIIRIVII